MAKWMRCTNCDWSGTADEVADQPPHAAFCPSGFIPDESCPACSWPVTAADERAAVAEPGTLAAGQELLQRHAPALLLAAKEFISTVRFRESLYNRPEFQALVAACADAEGFPDTRYRVLPTPCADDGGYRVWDRDLTRVAFASPDEAKAREACRLLNGLNKVPRRPVLSADLALRPEDLSASDLLAQGIVKPAPAQVIGDTPFPDYGRSAIDPDGDR